MTPDTPLDCLVVGGGIAGLSAALGLGRARRNVLVCSGGPPRNAPARHAHNFVTRDGTPPLELLATARRQLEPYQSVSVADVEVLEIERRGGGEFLARLANGQRLLSRTVILATGMQDDLEALPGLRELWGESVFACPFCHGWEYRDRPWAVLVPDAQSFHAVKLAPYWTGDVAVCGQGSFRPESAQLAKMEARGIRFIDAPVSRLEGTGGKLSALHFADGTLLEREALWFRPPQTQRSPLAARLGCPLDAAGFVLAPSPMGQTEVPGVFAVGDMTGPMQTLIRASSTASLAAGGVCHYLAEQDFEH